MTEEWRGKSGPVALDRTDMVFGTRKVVSFSHRDPYGVIYWNCVCNCGREQKVRVSSLTGGRACSSCSKTAHDNTQPIKGWYYTNLQGNARSRGRELTVTLTYLNQLWVEQEGLCYLTGRELYAAPRREMGNTASLDRIDSSLGYIEGNVVWVHKDLNAMKSDFDLKYLIQMCAEVTEYMEVKECKK